MRESTHVEVAVVGAGPAGLAAAYRLREGCDVRLFERRNRVGGRAATVERDGYRVDLGAHVLRSDGGVLDQLIEALDLEEAVCRPESRCGTRYLVRGGQLIPRPESLWELIRSPLLSIRGKCRLLAEPFVSPGMTSREESLASFVGRRLGREVVEYAAEPVAAGMFGGTPEGLELSRVFPHLAEAVREHGSLGAALLDATLRRWGNGTDEGPGSESGSDGDRRMFTFRGGTSTLTEACTGSARGTASEEPMTALVEPEATDAFETVWADEGMPVGATKASIDGYRNGLDHVPSDEIGVTVVVNDEGMADEGAVAEDVYGDDSEFPFDLRVYQNLTKDRLKAVLETDREFLHYVGHIEADGFECSDGRLDVRDMEFVGVDAFFLNGCASYDQGMALLERGAVGGVVTVTEVVNSGATRVGKAMVKLINHGFPLRAALSVASEQSFVGGQYSVVGDGDVDIVQRSGMGAPITDVERRQDEWAVSLRVLPTDDLTMGSQSRSIFEENTRYYLTPGALQETVHNDPDELLELLKLGGGLIRIENEIYRPESVNLETLIDSSCS